MPRSSLKCAQSSMCCQKWNVYMWAGLNSRPLLLFASENKRRRLADGSGPSPVHRPRVGRPYAFDHGQLSEACACSRALEQGCAAAAIILWGHTSSLISWHADIWNVKQKSHPPNCQYERQSACSINSCYPAEIHAGGPEDPT